MPARLLLDQFGGYVFDAFGSTPYLVGSAALGKKWRDVDVRLILTDEEYEATVGEFTRPKCLNLRWNALCLAFAYFGQHLTGLPIDFQIDQMSEANRLYGDQVRIALIAPDRIIR